MIVAPKAKQNKLDSSQNQTLKRKTKQTEAAIKATRVAGIGSLQRKEEEKKYYTNFDFYFKRTSFRTMTAYYKQGFQPFFDNWKAVKKEPSVIPSLITYANKEFPGLLGKLSSDKAKSEFIQLLKLLVFAHRHAKNDEHLIDRLVEFTIVRDPMYKYSREAQKTFFSFATFSFLFAWFEASPQARQF